VADGERGRITALGDDMSMADAMSSYLDDPITCESAASKDDATS
jgi:hypothetical protein